jgi:hypothetical protein
MIMSGEEIRQFCATHKDVRALVIEDDDAEATPSHEIAVQAFGPWRQGQILVPLK